MLVRCLQKNRDAKGTIINYTLQDETGKVFLATGQQIKVEINKGQFKFTNLQIDKAGRLVDKAEEKEQKTVVKKHTREQELLKQWFANEAPTYDECDKFVRDFKGEGFKWDEVKNKSIDNYSLPKVVIKFFTKFINDIRKMALADEVQVWFGNDWDDNEYTGIDKIKYSKLPKSVNELFYQSKVPFEIIQGLVILASNYDKLAYIRMKDDYDYDGWYSECAILTGNYENARKFIKNGAEVIADYQEELRFDFDKHVEMEGNILGKIFFNRFKFDTIYGGQLNKSKYAMDLLQKTLDEGKNDDYYSREVLFDRLKYNMRWKDRYFSYAFMNMGVWRDEDVIVYDFVRGRSYGTNESFTKEEQEICKKYSDKIDEYSEKAANTIINYAEDQGIVPEPLKLKEIKEEFPDYIEIKDEFKKIVEKVKVILGDSTNATLYLNDGTLEVYGKKYNSLMEYCEKHKMAEDEIRYVLKNAQFIFNGKSELLNKPVYGYNSGPAYNLRQLYKTEEERAVDIKKC